MIPYARDVEWSALMDALLRGVAHSLSNRAGALTALRDIGASDDESRELLAGEIDRLTQLVRLVRLIPADPQSSSEALEVPGVVREVVAVLGLHPQARDVRWSISVDGTPRPVRAERWVLFRALLLLFASGLADAVAWGASELRVRTTGDATTTIVSVGSADGAPGESSEPTEYARALADRLAAELSSAERGIELRLTTLGELRRREGTAAEPAG